MTSASPTAATADFARLPLSPAMLANLQQLGYLTMTPIQAASLPAALLGKDLIAQAKTGSGKTAAFALTLLSSLNPRRFAVQALVKRDLVRAAIIAAVGALVRWGLDHLDHH